MTHKLQDCSKQRMTWNDNKSTTNPHWPEKVVNILTLIVCLLHIDTISQPLNKHLTLLHDLRYAHTEANVKK